jgi:hypothetical protein
MSQHSEDVAPGAPAPAEGLYDAHNVLGTRTGERIAARRGQTLQRLPRGFAWRLVVEPGPAMEC